MTNLKSLLPVFKEGIVRKLVFVILFLGILWLARGLIVAALVNGYPVSRLTIIKTLEKQGGSSVLESLIDRSLVTQEAKRQKVVISQETIKAEISRIEGLLSEQEVSLDEALAMQGQNKKDLEEQIKVQKTVEAILSQRIDINESDKVQEEYQKWIQELRGKAKIFYFVKYTP